MFKQRHSPASPGFVPDTPKIRHLSLPELPRTGPRPATRADTRPPQTPTMPSSSRVNPTAGQPALPLKSILKGSKNAQHADSYESEGEILASKKIARSQYNIPSVLPPGSRLGKYALGLFYLSSRARPTHNYVLYLISRGSAHEAAFVQLALAASAV